MLAALVQIVDGELVWNVGELVSALWAPISLAIGGAGILWLMKEGTQKLESIIGARLGPADNPKKDKKYKAYQLDGEEIENLEFIGPQRPKVVRPKWKGTVR
jgi:hypothetical protein